MPTPAHPSRVPEDHPSENTILAYLGDAGEACENRSEIHAHVDGCDECHALIAALAQTMPAAPLADISPTGGSSSRIPMFPQVGALLAGRFRLDAVLGHGAMGIVYRAHDDVLGVTVAVKVVMPGRCFDSVALDSLRREASIARRLNHRNIRRIFDLETTGDFTFLVMESIDGETLEERLERGALSEVEALSVLGQVADAIEAAHAAGIVHRDLKPGNIVIERSGRVVVMDFGLARSVDGTKSRMSGVLVGTPAYWSPEQGRGERATMASDIFSFGLIAHQLITGRPFSLSEAISVPPRYRRAIERCVAQRPEHRFSSMAATREALLGRATSKSIPRWALPAAAAVVLAVTTFGAVAARAASAPPVAASATPAPPTPIAPSAVAPSTVASSTIAPSTAAPPPPATAAMAMPTPTSPRAASIPAKRGPSHGIAAATAVAPVRAGETSTTDAIDRESPYASPR